MFFKRLIYTLDRIKAKDPAARGRLFILFFYPGVHALIAHRFANWFYKRRFFCMAELISKFSRFLTNIEIHPGAEIGWGVFIDHGSGVVIGQTAVIKNDCTIYHGVTLGANKDSVNGKRHPTLENNVTVGCGAKILGALTVGENSKVAAGAVVLEEVPKNSVVAGIPAKVVKRF